MISLRLTGLVVCLWRKKVLRLKRSSFLGLVHFLFLGFFPFEFSYGHSLMSYKDLRATINPYSKSKISEDQTIFLTFVQL